MSPPSSPKTLPPLLRRFREAMSMPLCFQRNPKWNLLDCQSEGRQVLAEVRKRAILTAGD